ncbi:Protocadherin Fat 1, partial [Pseudolycoriella hygida]
CTSNKACIRNKCVDPCPGSCGQSATCSVLNHVPTCTCFSGFIGDPFVKCEPAPPPKPVQFEDPCNPSPCGANAQCSNGICTCVALYHAIVEQRPCHPSPCGPNSQCREINGQAVCSCIPSYIGTPPSCRPECVINSECPLNEACINAKCRDPCPGSCGQNAKCSVRNHVPICTCPNRYDGNPFIQCRPIIEVPPQKDPVNPCHPSPCGSNSECRAVGDSPSCSCLIGFIGAPPYCRPE